MLQEKIQQYTKEIEAFNPKSAYDAEAFRLKFLLTKVIVRKLF